MRSAANAIHEPVRVAVAVDHSFVLWGLSKVIAAEAPDLTYAGGASDMAGLRRLLRNARPELVVMDTRLGGESTLEHMPEIIRSEGAAFLLWTEQSNGAVERRALERGALAVIRRDAASDELIYLLRAMAQRRRQSREET